MILVGDGPEALKLIASSAVKSWSEMVGVSNGVGEWRIFKSITFDGGADWPMTQRTI
jgi:hypothetical protein